MTPHTNEAVCPICHVTLSYNPRYPQYVCNACTMRAQDKNGRRLEFFNTDISGGYTARYADTQEVYTSHECYIDGVSCEAQEAKFGGIVIIPIEKSNTSIKVKLNKKFTYLMWILGICSFGFIPLLYKLLVLKRYPLVVDNVGLTMRNKKKYLWGDIQRIEQAHVSVYGVTQIPGAIELYFKENDKIKYVAIPLKFIYEGEKIMKLITDMCETKHIPITHKTLSPHIPKKI